MLEILYSIFILSLIVTPLTLSLVQSARNSEMAVKRFTALELAQAKLEEITAYRYEDIGPIGRESFPAPYGSFAFEVQVVEDATYARLKNISVTVYYYDPAFRNEESVSITGARAKR